MNIFIKQNVSLAGYTTFGGGGPAEYFVETHNSDELLQVLQENTRSPVWILGSGSNILISDKGLPGLTIINKSDDITFEDDCVIVASGVWWDEVVKQSVEHGLWGLELMSEIPGSVGAALYMNITAYGQNIGSRVVWVEYWDQNDNSVKRIDQTELEWTYKQSVFQRDEFKNCIILRTKLQLSRVKTEDLQYQKALDVADELNLNPDSLVDRRATIIEARERAGSIWKPDSDHARSAGSFFKNPVVDQQTADKIIAHDESGKTAEQIRTMNLVHGGDSKRVSAAHVLLAAGFMRGQRWNNVQLHEQNVLKIEALPGATAQEIHDVMLEIQAACSEKLNITLEPEVRVIGEF